MLHQMEGLRLEFSSLDQLVDIRQAHNLPGWGHSGGKRGDRAPILTDFPHRSEKLRLFYHESVFSSRRES